VSKKIRFLAILFSFVLAAIEERYLLQCSQSIVNVGIAFSVNRERGGWENLRSKKIKLPFFSVAFLRVSLVFLGALRSLLACLGPLMALRFLFKPFEAFCSLLEACHRHSSTEKLA
jgi:hypothetical protein